MRSFLIFALLFPVFTVFSLSAQPRGIGLALKSLPDEFREGTFRALVIGNDDYRDSRRLWRPLKTAVNDAKAVAGVLRKDYGFGDVRLLTNATRKEMIGAFNELAESARKDDSIVIFYAGHGYLREQTDEGFWIPVDAEGRDDSTFVANEVIRKKVMVVADRARHVLLISDSCFSGALLSQGNRGVSLDEKTALYYRKVAKRKSVQILAAGGNEFVDDNYRKTGHSPFTYYLLRELQYNESPLLETTDLSQAVARNVAINVNQTPTKGVLQGAGHEGGEFFFLKNLPAPAPSPAVASVVQSPPPPKSAATGPAQTPQAAFPLALAPVVATPGLAAASRGGIAGWPLTGAMLLGAAAAQQYGEASDKHKLAQDTAATNGPEAQRLTEERDAAAINAMVAGVASIVFFTWAFSGGDGGDSVSHTEQWKFVPLIAADVRGPTGGILLAYRW